MLFERESQTARLNDELQFHLDQQIAENVAQGMTPEEARFAALRTLREPDAVEGGGSHDVELELAGETLA